METFTLSLKNSELCVVLRWLMAQFLQTVLFWPWLPALFCFAGGAHVGERSPQPHDQPHSPSHSASPGCTQRTPQHRPDAARGRHGRQLCGKRKWIAFSCFCPPSTSKDLTNFWPKKPHRQKMIMEQQHCFSYAFFVVIFLLIKLDLKSS